MVSFRLAIESMPGDNHFETGIEQNTLVAYWVGQPTVERLETMVDQLSSLWRRNQPGVYLFNVITADTGIPDTETRRTIAKQFESMRNRLIASAIVLEKSGVDGTMSRAIISTLLTITRNPFAMKVFGTRDAAAKWLKEQGGAEARAVVELARQLEERLSTRVRVAGGAV